MMRRIVHDNIIYSLQQTGGISMMWSALNDAVLRSDFDVSFVERNGADNNLFRSKLSVDGVSIKSCRLSLSVDRYRDLRCDVGEPFIFHSSYYRDCANRNARKVVTVHDFAYERVKFTSELARKVHHRQKIKAVMNADRIVCVSRNTRDDLLYYCPEIDSRKVSVIHNGVGDEFRVLHNFPEIDSTKIKLVFGSQKFCPYYFVLFVGSRASYKNFKMAVEAVEGLGLPMVVCGEPLSRKEYRLFRRNTYYECVNADSELLNYLYNLAYCLVYPSMYEGFGLPIVEAQKAGCPVIAYGVSSIPEVMGDSQLMIRCNISATAIKTKINLLRNQSLRNEEIERGIENAKRFSLAKMQDSYLELYESM